MVDHAAGFGATCIETSLVVDHMAEFDALSVWKFAHVKGLDAQSASKRLWWSTT
ncbi:MAG: hypothetical protein ACOX69_01215 [Coriobacteriales bacterium]